MTLPYAIIIAALCGLVAAVTATLLAVRLVGRLDARWRPLCTAYLTAQAAAVGRTLDIVDPESPPGQVYAPIFKEPADDETPAADDDDW